MYTLGIDVGSSSSKAVILEDGKKIIAQAVVEIGTGSSGPERVLDEVFEKTNLKIEDMANIIATGYGRFNVDCAKGEVSEITCHAKGALFECPGTTTILDIGGQDVKSIKLNSQGLVMQFAMNDKCAAGTGRFLDGMSKVLEIPCLKWGLVLQIEASCRCQQYLHGLCRIGSHFPFVEEHPERRHRSRCPSVHCR